jgi:uncharacterized membrane protein YqaE (UPF0057 family)
LRYLPQEFSEFASVAGVFNDSQLDVLSERLPELGVFIVRGFLLVFLLLVVLGVFIVQIHVIFVITVALVVVRVFLLVFG